MATYVLIPGAGSDPWYWHRVVPLLEARGHEVVTPELPCDDEEATFTEYADAVVAAVAGRPDPIVVGQSLGAYTAPLVCARVPSRLLVLLAPLIPEPGEPAGGWWDAVGFGEARRAQAAAEGRELPDELDPLVDFFHDVPPDVVAAAMARGEPDQASRPFVDPWPLDAWPDVPTRVLIGAHDRFLPAPLLRRVVRERLGVAPDEIPTGHLPALADPEGLVARLEAYRAAVG